LAAAQSVPEARAVLCRHLRGLADTGRRLLAAQQPEDVAPADGRRLERALAAERRARATAAAAARKAKKTNSIVGKKAAEALARTLGEPTATRAGAAAPVLLPHQRVGRALTDGVDRLLPADFVARGDDPEWQEQTCFEDYALLRALVRLPAAVRSRGVLSDPALPAGPKATESPLAALWQRKSSAGRAASTDTP
jgi:hypothetical protein